MTGSDAGITRIDRIEGTGIAVRGDHLDTDRIIPARYLKAITFEGLEDHLFEDDRHTPDGRPVGHPFANPTFRGASILLVNRNFGCGSSREHAPQALRRWRIRAIIGESFSDIFFGNALTLGLPCLTADREAIEFLMRSVETLAAFRLAVSVAELAVEAGGRTISLSMPKGAQDALMNGVWDAAALLLDRFGEVRDVGARLPYIRGF